MGVPSLALAVGRRMGDIVNFRKVRKAAARSRETADAARNRQVHGRSRAARELEEARAAKARRELDAHRIDTGEGA
jgi:Domain of unknown function (DUF4169)